MKSLFSVVCLTVLVGMATSCCLPDQGSFNITVQINATSTYHHSGGHSMSHSGSLSGSGAFDFKRQLFYMYMSTDQFKAKAFVDLKNKKMATVMSTYPAEDGPFTICGASPLGGKIGKPWQCVLDNDNIFINVEGSENYLLYVPPLAYGTITLEKGTCLPTGAEVEYVLNTTYFAATANVRVELTADDEIKDQSVFKAPCKAQRTDPNVVQIPTPDDLVQMLKRLFTAADSGPASESESEASPDSSKTDDASDADEDNSQGDGNESSNDEDDESESEEKKKKRGCALHGIIC